MNKQEYIERYGLEAYTEYLNKAKERARQYRIEHREEIKERDKERYKKEQSHRLEYQRQYSQSHKDSIQDYNKEYYNLHKEQYALRWTKYYSDPQNRAAHLINTYKHNDTINNRGECTITPEWMISNIFQNKCVYCGESDWTKLGCDRVDNTKAHTPDNVVCACVKCNNERSTKDFYHFLSKKLAEQQSV